MWNMKLQNGQLARRVKVEPTTSKQKDEEEEEEKEPFFNP